MLDAIDKGGKEREIGKEQGKRGEAEEKTMSNSTANEFSSSRSNTTEKEAEQLH
jgi:hypothetical protein